MPLLPAAAPGWCSVRYGCESRLTALSAEQQRSGGWAPGARAQLCGRSPCGAHGQRIRCGWARYSPVAAAGRRPQVGLRELELELHAHGAAVGAGFGRAARIRRTPCSHDRRRGGRCGQRRQPRRRHARAHARMVRLRGARTLLTPPLAVPHAYARSRSRASCAPTRISGPWGSLYNQVHVSWSASFVTAIFYVNDTLTPLRYAAAAAAAAASARTSGGAKRSEWRVRGEHGVVTQRRCTSSCTGGGPGISARASRAAHSRGRVQPHRADCAVQVHGRVLAT